MDWGKLLNAERINPNSNTLGTDTDVRNGFESDFGRIIFSAAMRRMHDKTQVFPLTSDDNIHSRLTHSMEVMSIGYSLGVKICLDSKIQSVTKKGVEVLLREIPIILNNACLVHDIGNPPFGHFGETAIQSFFRRYFEKRGTSLTLSEEEKQDFTYFDGNAQGFRVLTKLQILNNPYGLNLTYGTLGTYLKYPNSNEINDSNLFTKKRGVFQSEAKYLEKVSEACDLKNNGKIIRHPLCYLMEAADSICYLIMDIEDGFNKGWYNFNELIGLFKNDHGVKSFAEKISKEDIKYGKEITKMVRLRIYLIKRLVKLAVDNFLNKLDSIVSGSYLNELIKDDKTKLAENLQNICINKVFSRNEIVSLELTGHAVLNGLLEYYTDFIFDKGDQYLKRAQILISDSVLRAAFIENELPEDSKISDLTDYWKLRVIVDYISGMTDQFALNQYQKLNGQKIN